MRLSALLLPLMLATPVQGEAPLRVTTDSSAYCEELLVRVASQPGARQEPVRTLAEEGQRLCDTGHVRTGIAKLRRALRAAQSMGS
jgi:hypothetical protein